jgi:hypothetical protein
MAQILHRDTVLRTFFLGKDFDMHPEYVLKRSLVLRSHSPFIVEFNAFHARYPYLYADEWELECHSNLGKGDLVFTVSANSIGGHQL